MQDRCLSCGKEIEGMARFCDTCREQETREIVAVRPPGQRQVSRAANFGPTSGLLNLAFFAVIGCVALAVWLLALGGAETVGLRKGGQPQRQAVTAPGDRDAGRFGRAAGFRAHCLCVPGTVRGKRGLRLSDRSRESDEVEWPHHPVARGCVQVVKCPTKARSSCISRRWTGRGYHAGVGVA